MIRADVAILDALDAMIDEAADNGLRLVFQRSDDEKIDRGLRLFGHGVAR